MSPLKREFERIKLSPDFSEDEFRCPCPRHERNEPSGMKMDEIFIAILQDVRYDAKIPFVITSGYRCRAHQLEVDPKVSNSAHVRGMAADIGCVRSSDRYRILASAVSRINRIGIGKEHIHLDADPNLPPDVIWLEEELEN